MGQWVLRALLDHLVQTHLVIPKDHLGLAGLEVQIHLYLPQGLVTHLDLQVLLALMGHLVLANQILPLFQTVQMALQGHQVPAGQIPPFHLSLLLVQQDQRGHLGLLVLMVL